MVTFFKAFLSCYFVMSGLLLVSVEASTWQEDTVKRIKKVIKRSGVPSKEVGVWVSYYDGQNENTLYELNHERLFIPASLSKIITGASALDSFPLGHKFKTYLVSDAKVKKKILKGDLYLKGEGDPSFVSETMWLLVNELIREGINKVEGDVIVDDTYFDNIRFDKDREDSRVDRAYDAPVGAMSFNWNSVNIYVRPGDSIGSPAKVFADPQSEYIKVVNKAKTVAGLRKGIRVSRVKDESHQGDTIYVTGVIGRNRKEDVYYKNITRPDIWSGYQLKGFLQQRGVEVTGTIKTGRAPDKARVLADSESYGVGRVVSDMMKYSNNYVAEMLTKNLAAFGKGTQGNMQDGLEEIRKFLSQKVGLKPSFFNFVNPSGLTRDNKFRPVDVGAILNYIKKDFTLYPEFVNSLPIAGKDGTLKDRMKGTPAETWVRAKTGMLSGVLGLAGYASRNNKQTLTFVFIFNGDHKRMNKAVSLIDRMAVALVEK